METNDRMTPGAYDLPDTYRCIDCEALLQDITRKLCPDCEAYETYKENISEHQ